MNTEAPETSVRAARASRAAAIAAAGGFQAARDSGALPRYIDTTVSEALVLGLVAQGVRTFLSVFGHGSTEVGEVLRIYQAAGLVRVYGLRSELEASHAAAALRWMTGEKAAVVTSIGPGALQALAASIVPASDGLGVWYLLGDETTEDEGPNMQQIPQGRASLVSQALCDDGASIQPAHAPGIAHRPAPRAEHRGSPAPRRAFLPAIAHERATVGAAEVQSGRAADGRAASAGRGRGYRRLCPGRRGHPARGADRRPGRRRRDRRRARDPGASRSGGWCGGGRADRTRHAAASPPAQYDRRRLQRLAQRQLCHGACRPADRHRLAGGLPGRLLADGLPAMCST